MSLSAAKAGRVIGSTSHVRSDEDADHAAKECVLIVSGCTKGGRLRVPYSQAGESESVVGVVFADRGI